MKNKLTDLNNHLFAQLERLSDEDLTAEQLETEISRADAIIGISDKIINNADLQYKAARLVADHGDKIAHRLPEGFTDAAKVIEYRPAETKALTKPASLGKLKSPQDIEQATIAERRAMRERQEEADEYKRQSKECHSDHGISPIVAQLGLTKTEGRLLLYLAMRAEKLVATEMLYSALYQSRNNPPTTDALKVTVSNIRRKIVNQAFHIETVWGQGFIFRGDATPLMDGVSG